MSIHGQMKKITSRIDLKLNRAAKEIMDETKEQLRESVDKLWYSTYTPLDYARTYELIDAVNGRVVRNGQGDYTVEVFFDADLMSTRANSKGWGAHMGFSEEDFREGLISSIIHGMGGSDMNPRKGESTNVIEVVRQEAQRYANSILKKYL